MKLTVKVITRARRNLIKQDAEGIKVYLNAPAVDGKANEALIDVLAENYRVGKHQIEIIKGLKSRHKIIKIEGI